MISRVSVMAARRRTPGASNSFIPNWFEDIGTPAIDGTTCLEKKLKALDIYKCEMRSFPHSRSNKAIKALAEWRGASVGVNAAEAFSLGRKL